MRSCGPAAEDTTDPISRIEFVGSCVRGRGLHLMGPSCAPAPIRRRPGCGHRLIVGGSSHLVSEAMFDLTALGIDVLQVGD
jgi:hypothetical protein